MNLPFILSTLAHESRRRLGSLMACSRLQPLGHVDQSLLTPERTPMNITHINELKAQLNRVQHIIAESEQAAARLTAEEAALTKKEEAAEGLFMRTGLEGDLAAIKADLAAMKARREETERRLRVANNERARVNGEIGDAHQLLNELNDMIARLEAQAGRTIDFPAATITLAQGEHYAGIIIGEDNAPSYHLILLQGVGEDMDWSAAKAWAAQSGGPGPWDEVLVACSQKCQDAIDQKRRWKNLPDKSKGEPAVEIGGAALVPNAEFSGRPKAGPLE